VHKAVPCISNARFYCHQALISHPVPHTLRTAHLAYRTPCVPHTLRTAHLAYHTPCVPHTLRTAHLAYRTPCVPHTLCTVPCTTHLAYCTPCVRHRTSPVSVVLFPGKAQKRQKLEAGVVSERVQLRGSRVRIQQRAASQALVLAWRHCCAPLCPATRNTE
jgi:hypothetical protein